MRNKKRTCLDIGLTLEDGVENFSDSPLVTQLVVKLLGAVDHLGQPKCHIFLTPCLFGVELGPAKYIHAKLKA